MWGVSLKLPRVQTANVNKSNTNGTKNIYAFYTVFELLFLRIDVFVMYSL